MKEAVGALAEVDERSLDGRLDIHNARLVDRADIGRGRRALGVELHQLALLENRNAHLVARDIVHDHELLGLVTAMGDERIINIIDDDFDGLVEVAHRGAGVGGRSFLGVGTGLFIVDIISLIISLIMAVGRHQRFALIGRKVGVEFFVGILVQSIVIGELEVVLFRSLVWLRWVRIASMHVALCAAMSRIGVLGGGVLIVAIHLSIASLANASLRGVDDRRTISGWKAG